MFIMPNEKALVFPFYKNERWHFNQGKSLHVLFFDWMRKKRLYIKELKQRRRRWQWQRRKTIGLTSKTKKERSVGTCILTFGLFLCSPLQSDNVKWPNSRFCGGREQTTVNFAISFLTWTPFLPHEFGSWVSRRFCRSWTSWNNREVPYYLTTEQILVHLNELKSGALCETIYC